MKDPRAVEPLIAALKDTDPIARKNAADALGNIKDPRAVDPLIAALKDADPIVRQVAFSSLARGGDRRAIGPLIDVLKDTDPDVRWAAALELGTIGAATEMQRHANDVRVVEPLIAALRDTDSRVRRAAAESLSKVGYEAVAGLATALKDADSSVRGLAASALADLCIYGHCEPPYQRGVSGLLAALRQRDLAVIAGAYKWFIRPGPGSKVALIEEIDKRESGSVDALIESLDKFGGQSMAEDLLTCCKNPKIEQAVVAWAPRHGLIVRSVR